MAFTITERSERALKALFPHFVARPDAPTWLVDQLVDAELHRRGTPDQVTGAFHALALTQGSLLKEEYDVSTHGHADGWLLGAVVADPREFTRYNMRYGFKAGDVALQAIAAALKAAYPTAKVVRTHTDGFAALLGPTADRRLDASLFTTLPGALAEAVRAVTPDDGQPRELMVFSLGAFELTVVDPTHWQLLGALVWAECERAHAIARWGPHATVQARRVVLDGRLPDFER
jgi:GGDEF domain-containing protein